MLTGIENTTIVTSLDVTSTYYYLCWYRVDNYIHLLILQTIMCYVNPTLSVLGLASNMVSLVILVRTGLQKPSNVLLFGLVIADSMCLMMTMNFPLVILYFGPDKLDPTLCGFQYGDGLNLFLADTSFLFNFFGYWGRYVNTLIPVLITAERLLAVYRPMRFKSLVTTRRAVACIVLAFLLWLPWTLFINSLYAIYQEPISGTVNWVIVGVGVFYEQHVDMIEFLELYVIDILVSWVPLSLVISGCFGIWVKVMLTLKRRKRLTSGRDRMTWSPRTTRTLMTTCLVFLVTHVSSSVIVYVAPVGTQVLFLLRNVFLHFLYTANASSNLLVYVASNRKLLQIFLKIVHIKH